jgi:hypothetical protein
VNLTPGKPGASGNQVWERAGVAMNVSLTPGKPGASFAARQEQKWDQTNWP